MKSLLFSLSILFLIPFTTGAQERYKEIITDSVYVETYTYSKKDNQTLDLDIYLPAFDVEQSKATIIYVHGGGFGYGKRNDSGIPEFCSKLVQYGYAVASISYRLKRKGKETGFGCECTVDDKIEAISAASEDLQDATYFLIKNREQFGIDPYKIILSGSSAGAETVLNTAYQPPYCYDLEGGPVSYAGVIGMAGAIVDTVRIYDESAVPSLFFHGTCDPLVPYASAPHHYCPENKPGYIVLYGSYSIAKRLQNLHKPYWLVTFCGSAHEIAGSPMTNQFNEIIEFCYSYIIKEEHKQIHTIIQTNDQPCEYGKGSFPNFCQQ